MSDKPEAGDWADVKADECHPRTLSQRQEIAAALRDARAGRSALCEGQTAHDGSNHYWCVECGHESWGASFSQPHKRAQAHPAPRNEAIAEMVKEARDKAGGIRDLLVHGEEFDHDELAEWAATCVEKLADALEREATHPQRGDERAVLEAGLRAAVWLLPPKIQMAVVGDWPDRSWQGTPGESRVEQIRTAMALLPGASNRM